MTKLAITVEIFLSWRKAGNIPAETEAIESLAYKDVIGDSNSDSETGLDIKKAKRTKMLHILRECLTEPIWETKESETNNKLVQVECLLSKTNAYIDI